MKANPKSSNFRYVFFGTPEFAARILRRIVEAHIIPSAVVCAPDKPVGRKQIITPPPVTVIAKTHKIPVLQPETVRSDEFLETVRSYKPDLFVVVAYGKILPKNLLAIPSRGAINVHPSLLPQWRGPAPIQYAILSGDEKTGVSIMLLDEEMDHGPVLRNQELRIKNQEYTYATLSEKLAEMGAKLLLETIPQWMANKIKPIEQDHSEATFSKMIQKEDGAIDWTRPAEEIERKIRAFTPWPGAYTWLDEGGKAHRLRIIDAHCEETKARSTSAPGSVIKLENKKIAVQCGKGGSGLLVLDTIQPENKSPMNGYAFSLGHPEVFKEVLKNLNNFSKI